MQKQNIDGSPVDPPMFKDKGRHATKKPGVYKPAATEEKFVQQGPVEKTKGPIENVVPPQLNQEELYKPSKVEKELNTKVPKKKNKNVGTGQFVLSTWEDTTTEKIDQTSIPKEDQFSQKASLNAPTNPQKRDISTEDNRSTHLSLGSQREELAGIITDPINDDPSKNNKNLPVQKVEQLNTTADFMKFEKQAEEMQKRGQKIEEKKETTFEKSGPRKKEMMTMASKQQSLDMNYVPESEKKAQPHEHDSGRTLAERVEQAALEFQKMDQRKKGTLQTKPATQEKPVH